MSDRNLPKQLRLMADYECFPLWSDDGVNFGDIDPSILPISPGLRHSLASWSDRYDATLDRDDPTQSGFPTEQDEIEFKSEGERLLQCLRTELGPAYVVRLQT